MNKAQSTNDVTQARLLSALTDPARYPHPAAAIKKLETHISHILLTGDYAYKIKKPLNLGFLDFTSLAQRKFYCEEELRLNKRLAPDIYVDCIPICGSTENPVLGGDPSAALEYAVKMVQFPQSALLGHCLAEDLLQPRHLAALAGTLAKFHDTIARADTASPLGSPERVQQSALENFRDCRALLDDPADLRRLAALERWTADAYEHLRPVLARRKADGFIRECHGDLHLGNMILYHDRIIIFDCIEFNDELRWIDVMSDLAFLYMDLRHSNAAGLAQDLLNAYLEFSGDYAGLAVLPYYLVYRAMVRAKIAAIRLSQTRPIAAEREAPHTECRGYLDLALELTHRAPPFLLITHGVSGSGKSYLTGHLLKTLGAIRIRSDVERKRLYGLGPLDSSHSDLNQGIYTTAAGERTYTRLLELAEQVLKAGYPIMVDATFLEPQRRQVFRELARKRGASFVLLACQGNPEILRARVARRHAGRGDAAEADISVLERQLDGYAPPPAHEHPLSAADGDIDALTREIQARVRAG